MHSVRMQTCIYIPRNITVYIPFPKNKLLHWMYTHIHTYYTHTYVPTRVLHGQRLGVQHTGYLCSCQGAQAGLAYSACMVTFVYICVMR